MAAPPVSGRLRQVAVVGPRDADIVLERIAHELGSGLARLGLVVVTGGLGEARDVLVVRAAAAVVAVGGGWGTLAEVALALRSHIPVLGIDTWELHPPRGSDDGTRILPAVADADAALDLLRAAFEV